MKRNTFIKSVLGVSLGILFPHPKGVKAIAPIKNLEKTIFTPEMLSRNNYGLFIINTKAGDVLTTKNLGYAATVAWKLCWSLKKFRNPPFKGYEGETFTWPKYNKVNVFTDGWICPIGTTDEEVCEHLNNNPYGESFRLLTKEEVIHLIKNRNQGFL